MTENTELKVSSLDGKGALWTIAGTTIAIAAQKLMNGGLGGVFGGGGGANTACVAALAEKDSEIALLKAEVDTNSKIAEVYSELRKRDKEQDVVIGNIASRISAIETAAPLREQIVLGKIGEVATLATNGINCLTSQVSCLASTVAGITKTVVPIGAVCPQPMAQYNSWVAPTSGTTTGGTGA